MAVSDPRQAIMRVTVWDRDRMSEHPLLGYETIPVHAGGLRQPFFRSFRSVRKWPQKRKRNPFSTSNRI